MQGRTHPEPVLCEVTSSPRATVDESPAKVAGASSPAQAATPVREADASFLAQEAMPARVAGAPSPAQAATLARMAGVPRLRPRLPLSPRCPGRYYRRLRQLKLVHMLGRSLLRRRQMALRRAGESIRSGGHVLRRPAVLWAAVRGAPITTCPFHAFCGGGRYIAWSSGIFPYVAGGETSVSKGASCSYGVSWPRFGGVDMPSPPPLTQSSMRSSSVVVELPQQPRSTCPPPILQPGVRPSGRHRMAEDGSGATDEDMM
jgi:hypothetical protein